MIVPEVITLTNSNGVTLKVSNFGACIMGLKVQGKDGKSVDVVVGLPSALEYTTAQYLNKNLCLGSTIGRYAGRISQKAIKIEGKTYPLYHNDGVHLHGGKEGFHKKLWTIDEVDYGENPYITLSYLSPHLEEGYPGNLKVTVTYGLTEANALKIAYTAQTDKTTPVNLTNHAYFNLNGKGSVLDHRMMADSEKYLEVDPQLIPTGRILDTKHTRYDIRTASQIGRSDFEGFDDTFVLNDGQIKAVLFSKETGIQMEVYTNQPAIVIFTPTAQQFSGLLFNDGITYTDFPAICFETQNFPDAPNHGNFPSSLLKPGETYLNETLFKFSLINVDIK